jgi:hypothetical protein
MRIHSPDQVHITVKSSCGKLRRWSRAKYSGAVLLPGLRGTRAVDRNEDNGALLKP